MATLRVTWCRKLRHEPSRLGAFPTDNPAYRAWMFRIVRNAALDHLRRNQVRTTAPAPPEVDLWRYDDARIAKITVEQGLASLEASQREIIALIDIAGFSYAEAADMLRHSDRNGDEPHIAGTGVPAGGNRSQRRPATEVEPWPLTTSHIRISCASTLSLMAS